MEDARCTDILAVLESLNRQKHQMAWMSLDAGIMDVQSKLYSMLQPQQWSGMLRGVAPQ